ncbi:MAG: phospho-sugar mutase [Symbiobacteriia bacterium]
MTDIESTIRLWSQDPYFDEPTRTAIARIQRSDTELHDCFYKFLEFGTGGLRGIVGAGTNRMNRYTVRQATQGVAAYISQFDREAAQRGVVIAHDSRHFSREFALEVALVLAANGIVSYLWDSLRPTPLLSFAVRELKAIAGVVITASHNPPQYNGYKVYWEDGGQIPPERAAAIQTLILAVEDLTAVHPMEEPAARAMGLLRAVPAAVDRAYLDSVLGLLASEPRARAACRVLYTPLHGAGNLLVTQALSEAGFPVSVVQAQREPDPDFSTVKSANPEDPAVFALALAQARQEPVDLIMATDPDGDRLGVMVRDGTGEYRLLTGNQLGALLVDYVLRSRAAAGTLPPDAAIVKTIATSNMVVPICQAYGAAVIDTHTGFKYIGDKIEEFERTGAHTFLFGFEESCGYLGATFVRDKDAVMAAALAADAAAFHRAQHRTLYEALLDIWRRYGHFTEELQTVAMPGEGGQQQIVGLMDRLRHDAPVAIDGEPIAFRDDYLSGIRAEVHTGRCSPLPLDRLNVLHFRFADGGFVMVRPSGTEPTLKLYFSTTGASAEASAVRLRRIKTATLHMMGLDTARAG